MSAGEVKTLLTVPEAASALRIGRSTAYDLAHAWLDSGGTKGLPVVVIGGSLRVPVVALERLFAIGGFGPGWQSGLDGRRTKTRPAAHGGDAADACAAPEPLGPKDAETAVTSGASEPTSKTDPRPVESVTLEAEPAPPEPGTPKTRRPSRRTISSSDQLSLFDTPEP